MANRYWVVGSGNWTDTSHWSATSGGASGASVPGVGDDVYINDNSTSGSGVATLNTTVTVANFRIDAGGVSFALGSNILTTGGFYVRNTIDTGTGRVISGGVNEAEVNVPCYLITGTAKRIDIRSPGGGGIVNVASNATPDLDVLFRFVDGGSGGIVLFSDTLPNVYFETGDYTVYTSNSGIRATGNLELQGSGGPTFAPNDYNYPYAPSQIELFVPSGTTSFSKTITCNGGSFAGFKVDNETSITATWTLVDNLNCTGTFSWQYGPAYGGGAMNLDMTNKTITCGSWNSSVNDVLIPRTITVGASGKIKTYNLNIQAVSAYLAFQGLTFTSNPAIEIMVPGAGVTGTVVLGGSQFFAQEYPDLNYTIVTSGSTGGTINFSTNAFGAPGITGKINNLTCVDEDYTITVSGSVGLQIDGDLTVNGNSPTLGSGTYYFAQTSGTTDIDTNGASITGNFTFSGAGGTWRFLSTFNSSGVVTLNNGTLNFNNQDVLIGTFSSSNSNARTLTIGDSAINITGSGTAWNCATATNMTINYGAAGRINMTSASAKTFAGGSRTWPTVSQSGVGTLSVTGNNTFVNFTNTVTGCTVSFPSGTTTFSAFSLRGAFGSPITLSSTSTLSKASGVVGVNYLNLSNSTATGGAQWYAGSGSVDGGGNSGWIFSTASTGGFLAFF